MGGIRLEPVTTRADFRLWNGLIATFHYLGYGPFCGAQLRYLVHSEQGVLAAMGFSAAAFAVRDRDRWIGWTAAQRRSNRHWVVNNSRFLIVPWAQVPHSASHRLGRVARRVPADFQAHYGYRPRLLETFVEAGRCAGTLACGQLDPGRPDHGTRKERHPGAWQPPLRNASRTLSLHPTLAVTPERLPLGIFDCWSWTRANRKRLLRNPSTRRMQGIAALAGRLSAPL
ncbi:MAG: Druantia anti-phage system protein DruA [Methylococcales bacterium]